MARSRAGPEVANSPALQFLKARSRIELALYRGDPESVTERIPGEVRRAERALLDRLMCERARGFA